MENNVSRTTEEWENTLGSQIRELRQQYPLTQRELARRSNVSLSSLQGLESGRGSSLTTVIRVVRTLDRASWLESLAPPRPQVSPMQELRATQRAEKSTVKRVRVRKAP
jgi:transcriptional regulator with XRE-family HTH domain